MDEPPQETQLLYEARRRLAALALEPRFTARGDALKGEIRPGSDESLTHPENGDAIASISFTVDAEGVLHLDDPPVLRGLQLDGWDALDSPEALVAEIASVLAARAGRVKALCDALRRLGLEPELDGERLRAVARVDLAGAGVVALEGDDDGLFARTVTPAQGSRAPVPLGEVPVDLTAFRERGALERFLAERAEEALGGRALREHTTRERRIAIVTPKDAPKGAPTLGLLADRLGADAALAPGFTAVRELLVGDRRLAFRARHRDGADCEAELTEGEAVRWHGRIDLTEFPELGDWVVRALDPDATAAPAERTPAAAFGRELVAGLLPPVANEVWVMEVRVDEDDGREVRYRGVSIGGTTFGAPRVLSKAAFEAAYVAARDGYRMQVRVLQVEGDSVVYQRLGPERELVSSPKRTPLIVFLANFAPEAGAY